ncbi:MAG TPA: sigma-70 family RNA polymerase sigma factor [Gaiellaceae bacterium]|nr:sigma-70 family RNA polymerase sigma factor [Gaiellaceae bacterium]
MGDDSAISRHLRAGNDQRVRITEAVSAFRRLAPEDYGYFLATIEADLGGTVLEQIGAPAPKLLAAPAVDPTTGSLRDAVLGLLSDGQPRSTMQIRQELEAKNRPVNRASLNSEIFTLRKSGLLRSEGNGRGRRHTRAATAPSTRSTSTTSGKSRETKPRATRTKHDDDEEPAREPTRQRDRGRADAEAIYATAISGHHLLSAEEEWALAERLEIAEHALWDQLLAPPFAAIVERLFSQLETPVDPPPADARAARAADLDRFVASQTIEHAAELPEDDLPPDQLRAVRDLADTADRIRTRFVTCNLRLVPSIIRRKGYHLGTPLSMADLIQEGNFGLLKAVPRFDHRRGLRFSTFATWWIRHYLGRARQDQGSEVRVPVHLHDLKSKVRRATAELREKLSRDPTREELARALKVPTKSLRTLEGAWLKREAMPAFDSVGGEEGETPSYLASDGPLADEVLSRCEDDARLSTAVARLPPLLAQIVRRRFGLDGADAEILAEIGESMQLSRERIRQLEKKALKLLRQTFDADDLAAA